MLKVENLSFSYSREEVLKNINFTAQKGELITLIGPNGSGKSTILKCINSYLKVEQGNIKIKAKDLLSYSKNELAEIIAYIPQLENYSFPLTVFETILMGRKSHSSWRASQKDKEITAEVIAKLDLGDFSCTNINNLSGGQKQKVFIGRMMAQQADLILLDEPTNNLDLKHQLEIFELIQAEVDKGKTAVVTMHDLSLVSRFSDRIIMLKDGKIYSDGDKNSLSAAKINTVYGVEVSLKEHNGSQVIIPERVVV
ncbi:ABC transporter ATP-binding protein [Halanaerobium sp. Z-7514]|uniref:ABC transporter ATP-binding protein n=1 Tax=Halanaerobium polyolivorans TaxID=2886943 RepID=A0AAW4X127_9FIRM|nr:ABC transporter ATP-binding protein [Halanaerobium polyolivorans]MCC3145498.1 ABC transporter ATP-binding protein [Halanaerobium polyolivorans]